MNAILICFPQLTQFTHGTILLPLTKKSLKSLIKLLLDNKLTLFEHHPEFDERIKGLKN